MNYLVVGLGNIGSEYAGTRHNVGFSTLDALAGASNVFFSTKRYGDVAEMTYRGRHLTLLKPSTYMNLSGNAVRYWMQELKIDRDRLLVISDDVALPLGTLRLRKKGSSGGHNGLRNIAELLNSEEWARLRVGIGQPPRGMQIDFVLGRWTEEERPVMDEAFSKAAEAVRVFVTNTPEMAMNIINTRPSAQSESALSH